MPISRLFHAAADAQDAATKLRQAGYERVHVISGTGEASSHDQMRQHGIPHEHAKHFEDRIGAGHALVIVDPPFGTGAEAVEILDAAGPADTQAEETSGAFPSTYHHVGHDNAAPLSHAFGLPVLSHEAAPFSRLLGLSTLSRKQSPGAKSHGLPTLTHNAAPLSSALHIGTLTRNAAPLSSTLHVGTLSHAAAPLSRALGLPVLASKAAPLSKAVGWREILHDPAPLSRMLGLKVLSGDKTR